jgi:hypothetical protein
MVCGGICLGIGIFNRDSTCFIHAGRATIGQKIRNIAVAASHRFVYFNHCYLLYRLSKIDEDNKGRQIEKFVVHGS